MLGSPDLGLGRMLLGLWSAYGLAMRGNRMFFVVDSNCLATCSPHFFFLNSWRS